MDSLKLGEKEIQSVLAFHFKYWMNIVVPNANFGLGNMDLAVITKNGILWEIEIKVTLADWKADMKKRKWRAWGRVEGAAMPLNYGENKQDPARFYYCVPEALLKSGIPEWVWPNAGIIKIVESKHSPGHLFIVGVRPPVRLHTRKVSIEDQFMILKKLGSRYWVHAHRNADPGLFAKKTEQPND